MARQGKPAQTHPQHTTEPWMHCTVTPISASTAAKVPVAAASRLKPERLPLSACAWLVYRTGSALALSINSDNSNETAMKLQRVADGDGDKIGAK